MPSAFEVLTANSTAPDGSTAWEHLNAQTGGGGIQHLELRGNELTMSLEGDTLIMDSTGDELVLQMGESTLDLSSAGLELVIELGDDSLDLGE